MEKIYRPNMWMELSLKFWHCLAPERFHPPHSSLPLVGGTLCWWCAFAHQHLIILQLNFKSSWGVSSVCSKPEANLLEIQAFPKTTGQKTEENVSAHGWHGERWVTKPETTEQQKSILCKRLLNNFLIQSHHPNMVYVIKYNSISYKQHKICRTITLTFTLTFTLTIKLIFTS